MIRTANLLGSVSRNAGGLFESVRRLVQSLAQTGMEVRVFGLQDQFTEADLAEWSPVSVSAFRPAWPKPFGYSPQFFDELMGFSPDITHTHGTWLFPSVATSRYRRKRQCPYVISAHGMLDPWALRHSRWKKVSAWFLYEQAHLRAASCVRALSEAEARALRKLGLKNPIAIVPNGIDLPKSNAQGESMVDSRNAVRDGPLRAVKTEGRKILLYLGRIHPKKGLVNLLQAWASVQRQPPSGSDHRPFQWLLVLAGWDQIGHEAELKRLCDELDLRWSAASNPNLNRNRNRKLSLNPSTFGDSCSLKAALRPQASASVLFLGPQFKETKRACYVDCDAFILPSFSEGQPMVVLEAWAQGKPVLMTPQCNLPEGFQSRAAIQIEPTRAGVELGLRALFEMSDAERTQMGERGRELVAARFNWARVAEEMNQLYRWILGGGPKPACIAD